MLEGIPNFNDVFSHDELPKYIKQNESGVINLDLSTGPGTHWVCYYNDPKLNYVEYIDSFGVPPDDRTLRFLRTSMKYVRYNDSQLQHIDSQRCGWYCVHYIRERSKGKSPYDVLYEFTQEPSKMNEKIVKS